MSMKASDLAPPSGESVKFDQVGTKAAGKVVHIGDWRTSTSKFGKEVTSFKCVLQQADGTNAAIYPEKGGVMARAIGQAVVKAGADELQAGGTLSVTFSGTEDIGKGNPLKLFTAEYTAPVNTPSRAATDLF